MPPPERLEAGDGLALVWDDTGARLTWGHADWLGPLGLAWGRAEQGLPEDATPFEGRDDLGDYRGLVLTWSLAGAPRTTLRAYRDRPLLVFRMEAEQPMQGLSHGRIDDPIAAWPHFDAARRRAGGLPADATGYGHAYTEFALPTFASPDLTDFMLLPMRPAIVEPLFLRTAERTLLLAPLDAFHDQVIAVPRGADEASRGVRCGWHGDLDQVPAGFASEVAVWGGPGVRALLEDYGRFLRTRHHTRRPSRYADTTVGRLSYWTDNGAAYWYRTEPGQDVTSTLAGVMEGLRKERIPVHAVELDSWFYPQQVTRPFNDPDTLVPPTGLLSWEPREDALPLGVRELRRALGDPPLVLHLRHFSSASPYFDERPAWRDGDRAHPRDPAFYEALFDQAETWGAEQVEHDWLVECYLGVRGLREAPGRARSWQHTINAAARKRGLSLLWCMATPADFLQTVELDRVVSIRSAGDYRYGIPSHSGWCWFLYGNALARALGLWPFKDVFLSSSDGEGLDGDEHAELEALLSSLSGGPVGIGDRVGRSDRRVVMRTCRADGVLVKPDVPLAALERCYAGHAHLQHAPLVGEAYSDHPSARIAYVLAMHASRVEEPLAFRVKLSELGASAPSGPAVAWDWQTGEMQRLEPDYALAFRLAPRQWSYRVVSPLLPSGIALMGDPQLHVTAGDRRLRNLEARPDGARFRVLGEPGECPVLRGFSERPLRALLRVSSEERTRRDVDRDARGVFELPVPVGLRGRTEVELVVAD
ncbi:MAG: hypothetical protein ACQGVC_07925 [Myxococcota bacterium]